MRAFTIVTTSLACLLSSTAFAQLAAQSTASIPDFSGIWSHPLWPGFEPPLSGPGPIVNKMRRRQVLNADGRPLPAADAPLVSNPLRLVGDYTNPILKPEAAEIIKKQGELELSVGAPTSVTQCQPSPVPLILGDVGMEMIQQQDRITILYYFNREVRHIRINEPHPTHLSPSPQGDSVGRYEGDTLVIDTIGIKPGPFPMVDMFGTPHTGALHVVERYRLIDYEAAKEAQERAGRELWRFPAVVADGWVPDPAYKGKGLQLQFTVEDEGVFTTPWSATVTYRRPLLTELGEYICAENPHEYYRRENNPVPHADKPDF